MSLARSHDQSCAALHMRPPGSCSARRVLLAAGERMASPAGPAPLVQGTRAWLKSRLTRPVRWASKAEKMLRDAVRNRHSMVYSGRPKRAAARGSEGTRVTARAVPEERVRRGCAWRHGTRAGMIRRRAGGRQASEAITAGMACGPATSRQLPLPRPGGASSAQPPRPHPPFRSGSKDEQSALRAGGSSR